MDQRTDRRTDRVGVAASPDCLDCVGVPQTAAHLLDCHAHPTSLNPVNLQTNPVRTTAFLCSLPAFSDLSLSLPPTPPPLSPLPPPLSPPLSPPLITHLLPFLPLPPLRPPPPSLPPTPPTSPLFLDDLWEPSTPFSPSSFLFSFPDRFSSLSLLYSLRPDATSRPIVFRCDHASL